MIKVYTDGCTFGNGKEHNTGGYGVVIYTEDFQQIQFCDGPFKDTTNNRMELSAVITACKYIESYFEGAPVTIYTDSAYIANAYNDKWYINWENNGWVNSKKEPVKNRDLWEQLIPYFKNSNYLIEKVKGHAGNDGNELADRLSKAAARNKEIEVNVSSYNPRV